MGEVWRTFAACGWPSWIVLLLSMVGSAAGMVALAVAIFRPSAGLVVAGVALAFALSAPAMGTVGQYIGRQKVDAALSGNSIDPSVVERIRAQGYSEAAQCITVGVGGSSVPLGFGALGLIVALVRRKQKSRHSREL
jgi:hypothetical protein